MDPKEIDKDGDGSFTVTLYFKPQSYFYLGLAIFLILCILYFVWGWRRKREKRTEDDGRENIFREAVSAPWQNKVRREEKIWDAQKEGVLCERLDGILKRIGAFMQGFGREKEWVAPGQREGAHEKIAGGFRALKKEYAQKTEEKRELWEIKDYFRERKERPKYRFVAPPKPTFTAKEVDGKMDDIKKRLMKRDKGEDR